MSDDIQTVQMTHGEAMEALWRRGQALKRLQQENEKLQSAFEKAANDMRPMLRSMISRGEAAEIVRRAAADALKETGDE